MRRVDPEDRPSTRAGSEAIDAFDACLSLRDTARRTHEALARAQSENGLAVGGRRLCTVLRPRFLSSDDCVRIGEVAAMLASIFERAGPVLLGSDRLLDLIGATEQERDLWSVDPGYEWFTLTSRLDSFMSADQIRFVEYNAESPAGIAFCDVLTEIFDDLPAVRDWRGDRPSQRPAGRRRLCEALLWGYHSWGGTGSPAIAIIDWDDVVTKRDFELCAAYFRDQGLSTVITDPRKLDYRGDSLWCGDQKIDLLYRRVLLHELLERADEVQPLLQAYREGAVCMVNSPRSKLLHKKTVFALLSSGELGLDLPAEERRVVDATIPWTRLVTGGLTEYGGRTVDLPTLLCGNRECFALKPADDYGGRGVVLGWDTPPDEWERAVEHALGGGFIVQERVEVPSEPYPIWTDDGLSSVSLWLDTDPLIFRGRMGAVLTRLSGSALLNVSAGTGSAAPTFVIDAEER